MPPSTGRRRWWAGRPAHHLVAVVIAVAGVLAAVGVAWSHWSAGGGGTGIATVGSLLAPASPTVEASAGSASPAVSWKAVRASTGGAVDGYYVRRQSGGTSSPACASGPGSLLPATTTSCTDVGVPNGDHTYTVTAVSGSWTAQSDPSGVVSVEVVRLRVEAPATVTAGTPASLTVTAEDGSGERLTGYDGTVRFTSSDPGSPVLPADYTFTSLDAGTRTFANGVELHTAPSQTVTVADTVLADTSASTSVLVTAGPADRVAFSAQPGGGTSNVVWGAQPQAAVRDAFGNAVTSGSVTVTLSIASGTAGALLSCTATSKPTVGGVVTFAGCKIDKSGAYTLAASSSGLTPGTSASLNVVAGAATKLVVTGQPSTVVAGSVISPSVTVAVQDALGNVVTGSAASVNLAIGTNPAAGTLSGTTSVTVSGGVASFADLSVNRSAATGYTLSATSAGLTSATSASFLVVAGAPTQVGFTLETGGGTGGVIWPTQPKVAIQDALGNQVLTSTAPVTLTITSGTGAGGAVLTCAANPKAATSGLVTYTSCKIDRAATGYTLSATSTGLTADISAAFTVAVGPATKLGYAAQPSAVVAGSVISPAVSLAVQDAGGNTVTASSATVNLAIGTNPATGTLSGTVSAAASNGVATFSDLSLNRSSASGYTLVASATSLTSATSASFVVSAGAAVQVGFTTETGGGTGGVVWPTQPKVAIQDVLGNTVLTSTANVTLAISPGTGTSGAALTCTSNPRAAVAGLATYASCKIDKAGTGYTLTATASSLTSDVSAPFTVAVGPASKLAYSGQPSAVTAGAAIAPGVTVVVQDAGGNTVTTSAATVTLAIGTNPASGTLSGTSSKAVTTGVATFSDLAINRSSATAYTLVASSTGLANLTSSTFVVSAGAAAQLAFTTQPGGGTVNTAWSLQPKVTVQDALGNTVLTSVASVQLTVTGGTGTAGAVLTCTNNPKAAAAGVVTFAACKVDRAGTGYTLTATAGTWTAVSALFNVS